MVTMAEYSPYPILEKVFAEFKSVPSEAITENYLSTVCSYTKNVLRNIKRRNDQMRAVEGRKAAGNFSLYDINLFWNAMVLPASEMQIGQKAKDYAVKCLVDILGMSTSTAENLLVKAFKAIEKNDISSFGCMKFIVHCYQHLKKDKGIKTLIKKSTNKDSGLLDKVVANLLKYKEEIKATLSEDKDLKNLMSHVAEM